MLKVNDTGCTVSVSRITGDIVCQEPGPDCDCLIVSEAGADLAMAKRYARGEVTREQLIEAGWGKSSLRRLYRLAEPYGATYNE